MKNYGLLILRVVIGSSFMIHGYPKLEGGESTWVWLGNAAGLSLFPVFWGLCAALSEFFGGLLIIIGLKARWAGLFNSLTMLGAIVYHFGKNESILHPLELFAVSLFIFMVGAGKYSIDFYINANKK